MSNNYCEIRLINNEFIKTKRIVIEKGSVVKRTTLSFIELYDKTLTKQFEIEAWDIHSFEKNKNLYLLEKYENLFGLINFQTEEVIPCSYGSIYILNEQYLQISINGSYGVIDWNNSILISPKYSSIEFLSDINLIKVGLSKNLASYDGYMRYYGFYSPLFKQLTDTIYTSINILDNRYLVGVKRDKLLDLINNEGKIIVQNCRVIQYNKNSEFLFIYGEEKHTTKGFIFTERIIVNSFRLGIIDINEKLVIDISLLEKITLKKIFITKNCEKIIQFLLEYFLNVILQGKKVVIYPNQAIFKEEHINSYFKINFNQIEYYLEKIKEGQFDDVKSEILYI